MAHVGPTTIPCTPLIACAPSVARLLPMAISRRVRSHRQKPSSPSNGWQERIAASRQSSNNGTTTDGTSTRRQMTMATFDLRTGIGRKPDPLDYITKQTGCRCAPADTPHPLWDKFLDRVTNHNKELQHVFVFAYGT